MNDLSLEKFITVPEAAKMLGVAVGTLRNTLTKERPYDQYKVGHRIYLLREQVENEVKKLNEGYRKPYKTIILKKLHFKNKLLTCYRIFLYILSDFIIILILDLVLRRLLTVKCLFI